MEINFGNVELKKKINFENVKMGVKKVYPELEKATVKSRAKEQLIKPTKYGFSEITVEPIDVTLQNKEIAENGEYTADEQYDGLGKVTVNVQSAPVEQLYSYSEEVWN